MAPCTHLLARHHPLPRNILVRNASVLPHAHLRRQQQQQQQDRTRRSQQQLDTLHQLQQQQQLQQQLQQSGLMRHTAIIPLRKAYVFRYEGLVPRSPQAVSKMEYILGELPLGQAGFFLPRRPASLAAAGGTEARRHAQELESVVKRATQIMDKLNEKAVSTRQQENVDEGKVLVSKDAGSEKNKWMAAAAAALGASGALGFLLAVSSPLIQ
ncbi:hypothetical protein FB639_002292 [Coemansia asiatica]|nr:hypothetical protein FB639_002292 [Coemansia asiatica]